MATMTGNKYSSSVQLTANKFKKSGYKFVGWTLNKDGSGTVYKNCASVKKLSAKNNSTVTLYAKWKKKVLSVSSTDVSLTVGQKKTVYVTFTKLNSYELRWHNEHTSIATCAFSTATGNKVPLTITAKKAGTDYIKITNGYNGETATIKVTVKNPTYNYDSDAVSDIKDYIYTYGSINSDGNYYIATSASGTTDDGDPYSGNFGIVYDEDADNLLFVSTLQGSEYKTGITMTYTSAGVKVQCKSVGIFGSSQSYTSHTSFYPSTYDGDTELSFTVDSSTQLSNSSVKNFSNVNLQYSFKLWDTFLYNETGYTLSDIGFTNYE